MSKRAITLLALAVVLGGVIGAYFIVRNLPPKTTAPTADARVQVDQFDVANVRRIVLRSVDRTLTLVRDGGVWKADEPGAPELDQTKVEDIAYSFSALYAERLVEESPPDLDPYGLAQPTVVATAYLSDGTSRTYLLGAKTPTGNTFYLMPEGSPKVYAVWMNHGANFQATIGSLRPKTMPALDKESLHYIYLERRNGDPIELVQPPRDEALNLYVFGAWTMTRPYRQPRGVNTEELQSLIESIYFSDIKDFVEDNARDLARYGLEPPRGEIILRDETNTLHLLTGNDVDEYSTYVRYPDSRSVFTVDRYRLDLLQRDPFPLADKFAFIVNIDWVDRIQLQHRDRGTHTVDLKRESKDENGNWISTFLIDGKQIEEDKFRKFYQTMIGISVDGEAERSVRGAPISTFTYTVTADQSVGRPAQNVVVEFLDYNRDFYLVRRDGVAEFVTARGRDVEKVFTELDALVP